MDIVHIYIDGICCINIPGSRCAEPFAIASGPVQIVIVVIVFFVERKTEKGRSIHWMLDVHALLLKKCRHRRTKVDGSGRL